MFFHSFVQLPKGPTRLSRHKNHSTSHRRTPGRVVLGIRSRSTCTAASRAAWHCWHATCSLGRRRRLEPLGDAKGYAKNILKSYEHWDFTNSKSGCMRRWARNNGDIVMYSSNIGYFTIMGYPLTYPTDKTVIMGVFNRNHEVIYGDVAQQWGNEPTIMRHFCGFVQKWGNSH